MAALLKHHECSACGKRHHFTLPQGDLCRDSRYDYVCPETGRKAEFRPTADPEQVPHPPQGAVQLTPRPNG